MYAVVCLWLVSLATIDRVLFSSVQFSAFSFGIRPPFCNPVGFLKTLWAATCLLIGNSQYLEWVLMTIIWLQVIVLYLFTGSSPVGCPSNWQLMSFTLTLVCVSLLHLSLLRTCVIVFRQTVWHHVTFSSLATKPWIRPSDFHILGIDGPEVFLSIVRVQSCSTVYFVKRYNWLHVLNDATPFEGCLFLRVTTFPSFLRVSKHLFDFRFASFLSNRVHLV